MTTGKVRGRSECVERILATHSELYRLPTDPHHTSKYLRSSSFLAMLDGDRSHKNLEGKDFLPEMFGMMHVCFEIMDPLHLCSVEGKLPAHQEACSDWRTR